MPKVLRASCGRSLSERVTFVLVLLAAGLVSLLPWQGLAQSLADQDGSVPILQKRIIELEAEVSALREELARLRGTGGLRPAAATPSDLTASDEPPVNYSAEIESGPAASARSSVPPSSPSGDASLITGSVRPAAPAPGRWVGEIPVLPAESSGARELLRPKGNSYALLLGSFADQENLRPARAIVLAAHADLLAQLRFRSELISLAGKRYYNLVAGPFGTESESAAVCREIENRGAFCKVAKFRGTPLE